MDPSPAPSATLDPAALAAIRELDPDGTAGLLGQVVALYLEASPGLIGQIRSGLAAHAAAAVRMAAHTLKSSSANLGARRLAELCASLEHAARDAKLPGDDAMVERISSECAAVEQALREAVGKRPA